MAENFSVFWGSIAVSKNIIHEYCIAYKVWLKYENAMRKCLLTKNANAIDLRTYSPKKIPAVWYMYVTCSAYTHAPLMAVERTLREPGRQ